MAKSKNGDPAKEQKQETADAPQEKKSIFQEFKEFISRGNVIELAVGITVGTAFTRLVNSLVNNLIMPVVGLFLKGESFQQFFISLDGKEYSSLAEAQAAKAPIFSYGQFISDFLDFIIIAISIFLVIKAVNRLRGSVIPSVIPTVIPMRKKAAKKK